MHKLFLLCVDLLCLAAATILALILRDNLVISWGRLVAITPYLGVSLLLGTIVFSAGGTNRSIWRFCSLLDYTRIAGTIVLTVAGAMAIGFAWDRLEAVPRSVPILQAILAVALMTSARVAVRLRHTRRSRVPTAGIAEPFRGETVLVLGVSWIADLFLKSVRELGDNRVSIAGIIGPKEQHRGRLFQTYPILGTPEELQHVLEKLDTHGVYVDRIVVTTPFEQLTSEARDALTLIETTTSIAVDFFGERIGLIRAPKDDAGEPTVLSEKNTGTLRLLLSDVTRSAVLTRRYWAFKRLFDVLLATVALVLAAPLFFIVALAVAVDVGTPVMFWQQRPGRFGRRFRVYKFRTMRAAYDSDGRRLADEERTSAVGHFIRRTRFDELPQLFNILTGEMSFIGPRPLLPVDQASEHSARLAVPPGEPIKSRRYTEI